MRYRSRKITLRFTEEELAALDKKAKKAGLPRERFCRRVLNDTIVQEAPPAEFSELIRQVKRTGSNIDQLLKMARANGFLQLTEKLPSFPCSAMASGLDAICPLPTITVSVKSMALPNGVWLKSSTESM